MKAARLGIVSALLASVCCLGPFVLAVLGLGALGFGAFFGKTHWYFLAGAGAILILAWWAFLKEKRACAKAKCQMPGKAAGGSILILASIFVLLFAGLNVYSYVRGYLCFGKCQGQVRPGPL